MGRQEGSRTNFGTDWSRFKPATTERAQRQGPALHPRFSSPAQFHLHQPVAWEHLCSEPNPLSSVWFLTPTGMHGLRSNIRSHSPFEGSTWESDMASCLARPLATLLIINSQHYHRLLSIYCLRGPTHTNTAYQHYPVSWSQAKNGTGTLPVG